MSHSDIHTNAGPLRREPITPAMADAWVAKGMGLSQPLLAAVGQAAAVTRVVARAATPQQATYGQFMVCWPEPGDEVSHIWHIGDGGPFLDHLDRCYRALLGPDIRIDRALAGQSRLEMAFTNDVLQVQLRGSWKRYSMVRHHALMLFHGLLWLDEEPRSHWARLYDALLERQLDLGLPPWEEIEAIEDRAFEWYEKVAATAEQPAEPLDAVETQAVETQAVETQAVESDAQRYQQLAAAAIALLWREHRQTPPTARAQWQVRELSEGYGQDRYLADRWQRLRTAPR